MKNKNEETRINKHSDMRMYDEFKNEEKDTRMKLPTQESVEKAKEEVDERKM